MSRKRAKYQIEDTPINPPYVYDADKLEEEVRELNQLLSSPGSSAKRQCSYTTKHAYPLIEEAFQQLGQRGSPFKFNQNKKKFFDNQKLCHVYVVKRVVKLRFKCKENRCPEYVKKDDDVKNRKWTSYYGLVDFSFYFQKARRGQRPLMRMNFKVYGQQCFRCEEWGSGSVIKRDMQSLARIYSIIVENIMHDTTKLHIGLKLYRWEQYGFAPKKRNKDIKMKKGLVLHQSHLCEACSLGKCMSFYRPKEKDNDNSDHDE